MNNDTSNTAVKSTKQERRSRYRLQREKRRDDDPNEWNDQLHEVREHYRFYRTGRGIKRRRSQISKRNKRTGYRL